MDAWFPGAASDVVALTILLSLGAQQALRNLSFW